MNNPLSKQQKKKRERELAGAEQLPAQPDDTNDLPEKVAEIPRGTGSFVCTARR